MKEKMETRMRKSRIVYMIIASILDNPFRRFTMNARDVLHRMGVRKDLNVLEVGCGPGYFTIPAARIVEEGNLYALDISPHMTKNVEKKAEKQGLKNIKTITDFASNTGLVEGSMDLIICIDVLSDITDVDDTFQEMYRILKNDGTLSVYEPHSGWEPGAWKPDQILSELTSMGLFSLHERDDRILKFRKVVGNNG